MAKITETELRRKLRKGGTGTGSSSGPTAVKRGSTWEYTEPVLYLAYASNITGATSAGIISNQSDATGFQYTPFNSAGVLLNWRGSMFSSSLYQSGDATDYIWEDISAHAGSVSFTRYYTNSSKLMVDLGTPDAPGSGVTWTSIPSADPIPSSAFWVAEQYTMNSVESDWAIYPVKTKAGGFGLVSWTKSPATVMPTLNSTQWNDDVLLAMSAFTGSTFSSVTEIGYGTTIVITYSDGKLYGILKESSGTGTWVTPSEFIDGALLVDSTIISDKIANNAVTVDKILDDAINSDKIAANAVNTSEIAANAITANEIQANAIGANEIAANSITAGEIAANAITTSELAAGSVTASEIVSNTITANEMAANSVTTSVLAANAVSADKIQANAVTAGKITTSAITADKIATGAVTSTKVNLVPADVGAGASSGSNSLRISSSKIEIYSGGVLRVKLGDLS